jgi:hypothetical protein
MKAGKNININFEKTINTDLSIVSCCLSCFEKTQNGYKFPTLKNSEISVDDYSMESSICEDDAEIKSVISTCKNCGNRIFIMIGR